MKPWSHWAAVLVMGAASPALANTEDACTALLVHGVYDQAREHSRAQLGTLIDQQLCDTYARSTQDAAGGGARASYTLFDGALSLTREAVDAVGKVMCARDFSQRAAETLASKGSSLLNPATVAAWQACVEARDKRGLHSWWRFREEDQRFATLEVEYKPPAGAGSELKVSGVTLSPSYGMVCAGSLKDVSGKALAAHKRYSLSCERFIHDPPRPMGALGAVFAEPASLQVDTEAGQLRADWRAIRPASASTAPPAASGVPVGTIVPYAGRIPKPSDAPAGWLLCNGAEVKISQYPALHAALGTAHGKASAPDSFKLPLLEDGPGGKAVRYLIKATP